MFFDNLQVVHARGPVLEETHYYPFGLTMAGISSKALAFGNPKNKRGYNNNELQNGEFSDGYGLEFYDFNARTYDQQVGRFLQVDPMTDEGGQESWSPYHYSYNSPATFSDPDGKFPIIIPIIIWVAGLSAETVATATLVTATTTLVVAGAADGINNTPSAGAGTVPRNEFYSLYGNRAPSFPKSTSSSQSGSKSASQYLPSNKSEAEVLKDLGFTKKTSSEGTFPTKRGSIYKVPGERTKSGKPYVGRTKHDDPAKRGSSDGRKRKTEDKIDDYDPNNVKEGRVKEQKQIDKDGLENLDNKRNEIKKPPKTGS